MPHAGDDLASADEVKVYKDEGDEEQRSSENLSEEKIGLVTETEEVVCLLFISSCNVTVVRWGRDRPRALFTDAGRG